MKMPIVISDNSRARLAVSNGYARGKFEPVPRDRKDLHD
jgi:hypothetical protein